LDHIGCGFAALRQYLSKSSRAATIFLPRNIEHPTSNIERRTAKRLRPWMFDVRRSVFEVLVAAPAALRLT
jgi:hypothetical protein